MLLLWYGGRSKICSWSWGFGRVSDARRSARMVGEMAPGSMGMLEVYRADVCVCGNGVGLREVEWEFERGKWTAEVVIVGEKVGGSGGGMAWDVVELFSWEGRDLENLDVLPLLVLSRLGAGAVWSEVRGAARLKGEFRRWRPSFLPSSASIESPLVFAESLL